MNRLTIFNTMQRTVQGVVFDVRTKKHVRTIRRWSGQVTKDGRLGLYAPSRGGLELVRNVMIATHYVL